MPMRRRRPLADPKQYYAYVWILDGEVIWVGQGKNDRGRPTNKASWGGRPQALKDLLKLRRYDVKWQLFPCQSEKESEDRERVLIAKLKPKFNTAPGRGGWKGMHTEDGLTRISRANTGRQFSEKECQARSKRMIGNKNLLGHRHSEETRAKISAASIHRKPMTPETHERMRQAALRREAAKRERAKHAR